VENALDTLINIEDISFDNESRYLVPMSAMEYKEADAMLASASEVLAYLSSRDFGSNNFRDLDSRDNEEVSPEETSESLVTPGADLKIMNKTFSEILHGPRSDEHDVQLKQSIRNSILSQFKDYGVEAFVQPFTANKKGSATKGQNIIGIIPGKNRKIIGNDSIIVVGAHYDTVSISPGIDDNGSGVVVLLELARMISKLPPLNHTVMFVGFDLEELVCIE